MENGANAANVSTEKKSFIELPANFFVTEDGEKAFYRRHIPLREIRSHYNQKGYGFHWATFDAKLLQRLVVNKLLKEIVIERFEFTSKRKEVEDVTKLIIYGIFYEEINREICSIFVNSEFIEALNSKNPLKRIDMNSQFDRQKLTDFINTNQAAVDEFKKIITIDPFTVIENDNDLDEKTKNTRKLIINNILENIEPKNWFLFYFILKTEDKVAILQELNILFMDYLKKIKLADYLTLMIIELLGNIEKGNFFATLLKEKEYDWKNFNTYISNKENRKELLQSIEKHFLSIILDYKFSYHIKTGKYILTIIIINKTTQFETKAKKNAVSLFKNRYADDLINFLEAVPDEELSSAIGIFYLKFLIETCKEINLKFDAKVVFDDNRKETLSYLVLHF